MGISPFGEIFCTQVVEARKKSRIASSLNFQAHTWVDAADANLVFIAVYIGTIVTRGFTGGAPSPLNA